MKRTCGLSRCFFLERLISVDWRQVCLSCSLACRDKRQEEIRRANHHRTQKKPRPSHFYHNWLVQMRDKNLLRPRCLSRCVQFLLLSILISGKYAECHSCDASCKTCFGPQALDCSSCFKGFTYSFCCKFLLTNSKRPVSRCPTLRLPSVAGYFLDQDGSCVVQCPAGSYGNPATYLCEECSPNCESCRGNGNNCISCFKSGNKLYLHQGRCWSNCPE